MEDYSLTHAPNQRPQDLEYQVGLEQFFARASGSNVDKLRAFPKFVPVPDLGRFLARAHVFSQILNVHGSVVECGVHRGGGLMGWAALSAIYEPLNHVRRVIGFDTFEGFAGIHANDRAHHGNALLNPGGLAAPVESEISDAIRLFDSVRPLGHIPKVHVVKGDAKQTIPGFLAENPHFVCALLYLDFDLYEPTKVAIECLLPRIPRGGVIAFDELNVAQWPGETLAVLESIGLRNLRLQRLPHQPQISFAVLD